MSTISDERLAAWTDGELDPTETAAMKEVVQNDPLLGRRAAAQRALRERLTKAYRPVLDEPVPARLLSLIEEAPAHGEQVVSIEARRARRFVGAWPVAAAMAASLAVGVLVGGRMGGGQELLAAEGEGGLVARGELAKALTAQSASAPVSGPVRIGLTFRNRERSWCRTFNLDARESLSGLACRQGDDWRLQMVMAALSDQPLGEYRTASSPTPEPILTLVDEMAVDAPVDNTGEAAALRSGWR